VDSAGAFAAVNECINREVRCLAWLRRLTSGEDIGSVHGFIGLVGLDSQFVYFTPGSLEVRRIRR
jgi:hypothetical protein